MKSSKFLCVLLAFTMIFLISCKEENTSSDNETVNSVSSEIENDESSAVTETDEEHSVSEKEDTENEKESSKSSKVSVSSKVSSITSSKKETSSKTQVSSKKNNSSESISSKKTSTKVNTSDDFFDGVVDEIPEENVSSNVTVSSKASKVSKPSSSQNVSSEEKKINYVDHTFKYLSNFYSKITTQDSVTVTFIGGSVTDGYGSTKASENGWPELVCKSLQEKFGTQVDIRKKSIGGTGSYLGAFKYTTDTAPSVYTQPDLLFIEYAINDHYNDATYDEVVKYSESIVRMAYKMNPEVDIVYVLTFDRTTKAADYEQLRAHRDVANKYGLMCIKLADGFYEQLNSESDDGKYIPDGVHPNDDGYRMYADIVLESILSDLPRSGVAEPKIVKKTLPEPMSKYYENPYLVYSNQIDLTNSNGWEFTKASFSWVGTRFGGRVKATEAGSKLTLEFEGNHFGLLINRDKDMGKISVSIDGKEPVIVDGYRSSSNPYAVPIADGLSNGKHTVEITLIDKTFEIGGLLLN